jgi:hypothetical protein
MVIVGRGIVEKEERLRERVRQRLIWRGRRKAICRRHPSSTKLGWPKVACTLCVLHDSDTFGVSRQSLGSSSSSSQQRTPLGPDGHCSEPMTG